jgi:hypothetical protein
MMRIGVSWAVVLAVVVTICTSGSARAEPESAKAHYERGTVLFDLRRYAEAAREYELAFELKPDPALLFNIGQAYRLAHDYDKAIAAFRAYIRRGTNVRNRAEIEARIEEMSHLRDKEPAAAAATPAAPPTPPSESASPRATPASATPAADGVPAAAPTASQPSSAAQLGSSVPAPTEKPRRRLWWVGVVVAGVVVAGAAIGLGVGLTHKVPADPYPGSVSPGVLVVSP